MPAIVRLGDTSAGHCFPSRGNDQASDNVFVNGIPMHLFGMHWPNHCCGSTCHDSTSSQASDNTFANGLGIVRVGDGQTCGDCAAQGSDNTFCN